MAASALNAWLAIKSRHAALNKDAKFRPDKLASLCAKLDADGNQYDKQEEEKQKAEKILDASEAAIDANKTKITAKYEEFKQLTDQIEELTIDEKLKDEALVKAVSQMTATWQNLARERTEAAQKLSRLSGDEASLAKNGADQFKAKMVSALAASKRAKTDGAKTLEQIKSQVAAYQKIATGMKDPEMAADIGSLYSSVAQLYAF